MAKIDAATKDANDEFAPIHWVGKKVRHYKGGTYDVIGFTFMATTDEWGLLYSKPGEVVYTRPIRDFTAKVDSPDQTQRFVAVSD